MSQIKIWCISDMGCYATNNAEGRSKAKDELWKDAAAKMKPSKLYLISFTEMVNPFDGQYEARLEVWEHNGTRAFTLGGDCVLIPPKGEESGD